MKFNAFFSVVAIKLFKSKAMWTTVKINILQIYITVYLPYVLVGRENGEHCKQAD